MKICLGRCTIVLILAVVGTSSLLFGCGQKGDLYLSDDSGQLKQSYQQNYAPYNKDKMVSNRSLRQPVVYRP